MNLPNDIQTDVWKQVLTKIEALRAAVIERIEYAEEHTTPEVLAAGEQVNTIVEMVRSHEKDTESFVQKSFDELISLMTKHSSTAEKHIREQSHAVGLATSMTKSIIRAGSNIDSLSQSARLLTINAKILAASMTSQGDEVNALASEMKNLSDEIAANNDRIQDTTSTLLSTLPEIDKTSSSINTDAKETMKKMNHLERQASDSYKKIIQESQETLNLIQSAAYEALSHLQFHDPVVQRLKSIDTFVYRLLNEVAADGQITRDFNDPMLGHDYVGTMTDEQIEDEDEHVVDEGELLLF